jgi:hypothetical protein
MSAFSKPYGEDNRNRKLLMDQNISSIYSTADHDYIELVRHTFKVTHLSHICDCQHDKYTQFGSLTPQNLSP